MRRLLRRGPEQPPEPLGLPEATEEDRRFLSVPYDDSVPLPPGAESELRDDNPRLGELRDAYAALDLPVTRPSRWAPHRIEAFLDLRHFRGDTLITWHYRESRRVTELKYFVHGSYVRSRDGLGLLGRLGEDGAYGCWTFDFEGHGRYSRDLLGSVNELNFLERAAGLVTRPGLRVLDVGAGYGRLAHRMAQAAPDLADYCCVDAIPESTFLCEHYLRFRGVCPPARVVPLHEIPASLSPGSFDLAVNVHSFAEMPLAAVEWWVGELRRLEVPRLLIVPNDPEGLLALEPDGEKTDFAPALAAAGYELRVREPVLADPAVADLLGVRDHFHLFELGS